MADMVIKKPKAKIKKTVERIIILKLVKFSNKEIGSSSRKKLAIPNKKKIKSRG